MLQQLHVEVDNLSKTSQQLSDELISCRSDIEVMSLTCRLFVSLLHFRDTVVFATTEIDVRKLAPTSGTGICSQSMLTMCC